MTILHIITRLILGGAQQNTILTCGAQYRNRHDVTLVHGPIYGPEGSLQDEARRSGARLVEIPTLVRRVCPSKDWSCYQQLRSLIRDLQPDVVHTHSSKAGILGRAAAWHEKIPVVVHTVHGLPFHNRQNRLVSRMFIAAERWAARRCHQLIAISPAMVEAFNRHHIAGLRKFTVIPSGIEVSRFRIVPDERFQVRQQLGIGREDPVLGILSRLDPLKGHDDLLDIFERLRRDHPRLRMLFIGDGWHRPRLERRIATAGLGDHVILAGMVPPNEVTRWLSAVDVKVLPSYQEGQSRTLVEALLCGCGIVAYDVGGIGSVCIDGQTGRLVPVGDTEALAEAIGQMFDRPDQRAVMVEQGQAFVRRMFDAESMLEMIEQVYYEVLDRSG